MLAALETQRFDLVILDIMLGGEDGLSLCRQIRANTSIPIIMLTSMSTHTDRIVGLELGADDYVTKPFDARELLARVRAVLRRTTEREHERPTATEASIRPALLFAGWRLDVSRRELRSASNALTLLSGAEFDLLLVFAEHSQEVLSRDRLLDLVHSPACVVFDRSIDVQVSRLRRKLEVDVKTPALIRTVRNGGYVFTPAVTRA